MSLSNIQGKLSRKEMKEIMAGSFNTCSLWQCGYTSPTGPVNCPSNCTCPAYSGTEKRTCR